MAVTLLLVRHAEHELLGKVLTGRMGGVRLGARGRDQAARLARRLAATEARAVWSSPRERTRETAAPIAEALGVVPRDDEALDEIDFGAWTGRSFAELENDETWRSWNAERGRARAPGGETMAEAQARIVTRLAGEAETSDRRPVVLVSHGDLIKAAVLHVLGAPLQSVHTFDIDPASVTTLVFGTWGGKVIGLNERIVP